MFTPVKNNMQRITAYFFVFPVVYVCYAGSPDLLFNVQSSRNNLLYVGIDNRIAIKSNISDSIMVQTNNGLVFFDDSVYVFIPAKTGEAAIFVLDGRSQTKGEQLAMKILEVLNFPQPQIRINGKIISNDQALDLLFLLQSDSIDIFFTDDIYEIQKWYQVKGFTFGYIIANRYMEFENNGKYFSEETKKAIKKLMPGMEISFRILLESGSAVFIRRPLFRYKVY